MKLSQVSFMKSVNVPGQNMVNGLTTKMNMVEYDLELRGGQYVVVTCTKGTSKSEKVVVVPIHNICSFIPLNVNDISAPQVDANAKKGSK